MAKYYLYDMTTISGNTVTDFNNAINSNGYFIFNGGSGNVQRGTAIQSSSVYIVRVSYSIGVDTGYWFFSNSPFPLRIVGHVVGSNYYWYTPESNPATESYQFVIGNRIYPNVLGNVIDSSWPVSARTGKFDLEEITSQSELFEILDSLDIQYHLSVYPITYRPTNCSFPNAPTEAAIGDTVVVPVSFPDGYGIVNASDIYVTNNGVVVPSQYSNGVLTFTMPDPS